MLALVSRVKRVFRLSTPRITRLHSSGSSRGYCWSTVTGHTRGTEICESDASAHAHASHLPSPQDRQLFLQEYRLYWDTLVVPNLLWLEFTIVCFRTPSPFALVLTSVASVFEYTFLLWWNSFWTIAPAIAIGLFDRIVGMWSRTIIAVLELIPISRR